MVGTKVTGKSFGKVTGKSFGKQAANAGKRAMKLQRARDTRMLNDKYKAGDLRAVRLYYNAREEQYYSCLWDKNIGEEGGYTKRSIVEDIKNIEPFLVEVALRRPNEWVGPKIGDPGDGEAPEHLNTRILTIYQQHGNPYCFTYSFASALFYCGFKDQAITLAEQASIFSDMDFDTAIKVLLDFMVDLVPVIGLPKKYGIRTKSHSRVKRKMTWVELFTELTAYPTIIIPRRPDGSTTHAFCVVDDLIFDSITPHAMKLHWETVQWIFNGEDVTIHRALRFQTKISPEGSVLDEFYRRPIKRHWV